MERLNLPLLTHDGHELAAQGGGHQGFGDPLLLRRGLDHGVRVIVAHCVSLGTTIDPRRPGEPETATSSFRAFILETAVDRFLSPLTY